MKKLLTIAATIATFAIFSSTAAADLMPGYYLPDGGVIYAGNVKMKSTTPQTVTGPALVHICDLNGTSEDPCQRTPFVVMDGDTADFVLSWDMAYIKVEPLDPNTPQYLDTEKKE